MYCGCLTCQFKSLQLKQEIEVGHWEEKEFWERRRQGEEPEMMGGGGRMVPEHR